MGNQPRLRVVLFHLSFELGLPFRQTQVASEKLDLQPLPPKLEVPRSLAGPLGVSALCRTDCFGKAGQQ